MSTNNYLVPIASQISISHFLKSLCQGQASSYQIWSMYQQSGLFNSQSSCKQQFDNNYEQPYIGSTQSKDFKEKFQYLFQVHQELMELKNKSIYRKLMTNEETKRQGGLMFDNTEEFLEKNLKSVYIEDLSKLFIKFASNYNDEDLKISIKKVLKNKKNKQNENNEIQENSIKQQQKKQKKQKKKDKFDNMIDNIAKNLQEIIKE